MSRTSEKIAYIGPSFVIVSVDEEEDAFLNTNYSKKKKIQITTSLTIIKTNHLLPVGQYSGMEGTILHVWVTNSFKGVLHPRPVL